MESLPNLTHTLTLIVQVLMESIEQRMSALGVRILALPATHDAVVTWIAGFGFRCAHGVLVAVGLAFMVFIAMGLASRGVGLLSCHKGQGGRLSST